ncbi:MAG: murein L,D-transpeptidase catalytic domain family protein [Chitinophagaceae bacterium]
MYDELQLATLGLSKPIFEKAIAEWDILSAREHIEKTNILSIADLSQSSKAKRLYVMDIKNKRILFNTYVAHGRNSGDEFATSFSNKENSYQSSLGFYITANTYQGAHGLSLKLKGIEKGINDIAETRGIVVHGASYVSESFINNFGRLGRSQGCPAVPIELCTPIINSIKGGSCFYMFYPDKNYFKKTALI